MYENIGIELNLGKFLNTQLIQTLWSGYGQLVRLEFEQKSVIIKHVKLPKNTSHPKGWNTNLSHERKQYSYEVEVNWYENFTQIQDENCMMAKGLKTYQNDEEYLIVMEDLRTLGFECVIENAIKEHLISALSWLANFHAKFLGVKSQKLWEVGTYWHLDTRPDELKALDDKELKRSATQLDDVLKNAKFQTLVHGDAKLANFCFNKQGTSCATVDFQYVGKGCGMKDVILFISSSVEPNKCASMQDWLLEVYFDALKKAINYYHPTIDASLVCKEYEKMFSIAWADFQRFIKGWSPKHHKINDYTESLTKKTLLDLLLK